MLERKITKELLKWKSEPNKPCLIVKGARQVGKTFIVEKFAKDNYENYIYINFELAPSLKGIFDGDLDFTTLRMKLEAAFPGVKIEKGQTLLFLDEIGACPNARVALKTFAMDGTLDVIGSGSLLGMFFKDITSLPVGYERQIELMPLDFEEFLWALGISADTIAALRSDFVEQRNPSKFIIDKFSEYFKQYVIVGGMPAAVNAFLQTKSINAVREVQAALVEGYKGDVIKYAPTADRQKIIKAFESLPVQLAKKNKKFMWSDIDSGDVGASERKYGSTLAWLKDAGVVNFCYNLSEPTAPLNAHRRLDTFKVYMRDTGLLMSMLEPSMATAVLDGDNLVDEGGITENVIASELVAHGHNIAYFEKRSELEIDFVLNLNKQVTAIEVKSGKHTQAKSMKSIIENYQTVTRYIKLEKNTAVTKDEKGCEYYPLFMGMFV